MHVKTSRAHVIVLCVHVKFLRAHVKGITCAREVLVGHVKGITCTCEVSMCARLITYVRTSRAHVKSS